jgi:hypothetical protein
MQRSPHSPFLPPIEPLESRIAPAAVLINSKTVSYTDIDGDTVTITSSLPIFTNTDGFEFTDGIGGRQQLDKLTLGVTAKGTVLTIKARASSTGDGLVNVGYIDASGVDLKSVTVAGDLGQIDAGDAALTTPALGSLTVNSLGLINLFGPAGTLETISTFTGGIGSVKVLHDVREASIFAVGAPGNLAKISSVSIGGSLVGTGSDDSGRIDADGTIGSVTIGGSIRGGDGSSSGRISAGSGLGAVTVKGGVFGGDGTSSGRISSGGGMGAVTITQSLEGGDGNNSGLIDAGTDIAKVTIKGSVVGGDGDSSGRVSSNGKMGLVNIGRDLVGGDGDKSGSLKSDLGIASATIGGSILGGDGDSSGGIKANGALGATKVGGDIVGRGLGTNASFSIDGTGYVEANTIASLQIGGSLVAGKNRAPFVDLTLSGDLTTGQATVSNIADTSGLRAGLKVTLGAFTSKIQSVSANSITLVNAFTGSTGTGQNIQFDSPTLSQTGFVHAIQTLGAVTIGGDLRGSSSNPATLSAGGLLDANLSARATSSLAIAKVTVSGSVKDALIGAGLDDTGGAVNPDAQIGAVTVAHDWVTSNLVAGIDAGTDTLYGTADDTAALPGAGYSDRASIVSKIASVVIGGQVLGSSDLGDNFGFVARSIGSLKVSGINLQIRTGTNPASFTLSPSTTFDVKLKEL